MLSIGDQITNLKKDLKEEVGGLKKDLKEEVGGLKKEVRWTNLGLFVGMVALAVLIIHRRP